MRVIIFVLLFNLNALAQNSITRIFPQTPPPSTYATSRVKPIIRTSDGGYLCSFNPYAGNIHGAYPVNWYLLKLDSLYNPTWKRNIYASSTSLPTGNNILSYKNGWNSTIEKINNNGQIIWTKTIGRGYPFEIEFNDQLLIGSTMRFVGFIAKQNPMAFYDYSKGIIVDIDTLGNLLNIDSFSIGSNFISIDRIVKDAIGNQYLLCGATITKLSPFGAVVWSSGFNATYFPSFYDACVLANGDVLACGGYNNPLVGTNSVCIMKINFLGNLSWLKTTMFPGFSNGIQPMYNGNFLVSALHAKYYGDSLKPFLYEIDLSGNVIWSKRYFYTKGISAPYYKSKNEYLLASYFNGPMIFKTDSLGNYGCLPQNYPFTFSVQAMGMNAYSPFLGPITLPTVIGPTITLQAQVYKDTCMVSLNLSDRYDINSQIKLGPNPSNGNIKIESNVEIGSLRVYDVNFKLISSYSHISNGTTEIVFENLRAGIYFIIFEKDNIIATKKILIE